MCHCHALQLSGCPMQANTAGTPARTYYSLLQVALLVRQTQPYVSSALAQCRGSSHSTEAMYFVGCVGCVQTHPCVTHNVVTIDPERLLQCQTPLSTTWIWENGLPQLHSQNTLQRPATKTDYPSWRAKSRINVGPTSATLAQHLTDAGCLGYSLRQIHHHGGTSRRV